MDAIVLYNSVSIEIYRVDRPVRVSILMVEYFWHKEFLVDGQYLNPIKHSVLYPPANKINIKAYLIIRKKNTDMNNTITQNQTIETLLSLQQTN